MFFDSIIRKPNWTELEKAYKKLSNMYQDLYEEKQTELEVKDQQIKQLSSKVRQWMRKYHQLEVSTNEDSIDVTEVDSQDKEYVEQLQDIVAELSKKNHRLEERIRARAAKKNSDQRCEVIEIDQSIAKAETVKAEGKVEAKTKADLDKTALKAQKRTNKNKEQEEIELIFSPKFQALLERHAQECNG